VQPGESAYAEVKVSNPNQITERSQFGPFFSTDARNGSQTPLTLPRDAPPCNRMHRLYGMFDMAPLSTYTKYVFRPADGRREHMIAITSLYQVSVNAVGFDTVTRFPNCEHATPAASDHSRQCTAMQPGVTPFPAFPDCEDLATEVARPSHGASTTKQAASGWRGRSHPQVSLYPSENNHQAPIRRRIHIHRRGNVDRGTDAISNSLESLLCNVTERDLRPSEKPQKSTPCNVQPPFNRLSPKCRLPLATRTNRTKPNLHSPPRR